MHEIEDWLAGVRAARPAPVPDSPWTLQAQSVLERALQPNGHRPARRRRHRQIWLSLGLAAACALVLAVLVRGGTSPQPHPFPPAFGASAAQVLDRAAFVALQTGAPAPRPNQYVYSRVEQTGGHIVQSWMSVSGARDSVIGSLRIAGCADGHLALPGRPAGQRCTPTRAYFPSMPTTRRGMLGYLERTQHVRLSNINDLAKVVGSLLDSDYLLPAQQAALFRFLASTRGLTVVPRVTDAAGRPGVGVAWRIGGGRSALIFDPRTYAYLGTVTRGVAGQISGDARLAGGIADRLGQVPGTPSTPVS